MRAYILTAHNVIRMDDYQKITNEEVLTGEQLPLERIKSFVMKAAFETLEEAVNNAGSFLFETEEDFEKKQHFQEEEKTRISVSIDIAEISEDEFNEINVKDQSSGYFVSAMPLYEMSKQ